MRQPEAEDAVHTVEVRAVAVSDDAKGRLRFVVPEGNDGLAGEAAEVAAVGIVQVKRLVRFGRKGGIGLHVEVARLLGDEGLGEELLVLLLLPLRLPPAAARAARHHAAAVTHVEAHGLTRQFERFPCATVAREMVELELVRMVGLVVLHRADDVAVRLLREVVVNVVLRLPPGLCS